MLGLFGRIVTVVSRGTGSGWRARDDMRRLHILQCQVWGGGRGGCAQLS